MYKIKFYFILLIATITLNSCSKDDKPEPPPPPREYAPQYATESVLIETYLKTNYITVLNHPGLTDDQDVIIKELDADHSVSIWDQQDYPLKNRKVELHGITYVLYYLVLREGVGINPCNVDEVFTSYNGKYLTETNVDNITTISATPFEEVVYPQIFYGLYSTIRAWKEIFPQFKSGNSSSNADGTVSYTDFGAGVMFAPSGLAYYNGGSANIPPYSPLVFSFKLYNVKRSDLEQKSSGNFFIPDPDGVLSYQEDLNGDGYMWTASELPVGAINPDDTDGDGVPDFLDFDDDGDGFATKGEVKDANGVIYPFDLIPDCSGDQIDPNRLKRHLDKECIKMNQ